MGRFTNCCKPVRTIFWTLAVIIHACPVPALAAEALQPFNLKARYNLTWNGLSIGRLVVVASEDSRSYSMLVDSKSRGLAALISKEKTVTNTRGTKTESGEYRIARYEFRPQGKDAEDYITLDYDAEGKLAKRDRPKDDDPRWRPPVAAEAASQAHDPLSVVFILREKLYASQTSKLENISARTYDGMRLFEMKLKRLGSARIPVAGKPVDAIKVAVSREPIDGYTPKEIKKYQKGDPPILFYFSKDTAMAPLRAEAETFLGAITLSLEKYE